MQGDVVQGLGHEARGTGTGSGWSRAAVCHTATLPPPCSRAVVCDAMGRSTPWHRLPPTLTLVLTLALKSYISNPSTSPSPSRNPTPSCNPSPNQVTNDGELTIVPATDPSIASMAWKAGGGIPQHGTQTRGGTCTSSPPVAPHGDARPLGTPVALGGLSCEASRHSCGPGPLPWPSLPGPGPVCPVPGVCALCQVCVPPVCPLCVP